MKNQHRSLTARVPLALLFAGTMALLLVGCGSDSDLSTSSGGSGGGTWLGPSYTSLFAPPTVNGSGCLVFGAGIKVIAFDAPIAGNTARIEVSGSVDAANGYLAIYAFSDPATAFGGYKAWFSMDSTTYPGESNLILFHDVGFPVSENAPSNGGFAPFTLGQSFTSWVSDFDKLAESADSWWPDTTPGAAGTGAAFSIAGMGTPANTGVLINGVSSKLCSYAIS